MSDAERIPILYLAPWVDFGGSDKGTVDWFRWLEKRRFRASLITTQPSENRRISEVTPYADEVWALPQLMPGDRMPRFILDFIVSREIRVIHVMNSRLAFELLPDLAALDDPPAVVVQLHVEEEDRSGYVRLVTTRYGNLVDAFSVSSEHLAAAVAGYGVSRNRIVVIPTGVDALGEFNPGRARRRDLGPGPHILYPGRLTPQKNPLLMVQVAAQVAASRPDACFHVVGDGDLEASVRAAIRRRGLDDVVRLHQPVTDLASWYAASDMLLMTSVFEGIPYVLYEAMAMGLPSVVPRLPGNAELLGEGGGILVAPRDQPEAYASAVLALLNGNSETKRVGKAARDRVLRGLSVQKMAASHAELYQRLVEAQRPISRPLPPARLPSPHRLPTRPSRGQPMVTVVVPCFNHGCFLPEALTSIRGQTYPNLEVFVVDDASTDKQTLGLLDKLDSDPDVTVLRRAVNAGPSATRNTGIAAASGRYLLPVDADNVLLHDAITSLVRQLQSAPERVGFIYPNLQFFGNRHDYFEAPHFDLQELLKANYCDTCSLIDRAVFDAGFYFAEDIDLGHEDWDFFLRLATHRIHGEPAHQPTLRYRKTGFTRSDTVQYRAKPFADVMRDRHPALYPSSTERVNSAAAHRQEASLKAAWQPAISLLVLEEVDTRSAAGQRLVADIAGQTLSDAEVIAPFSDLPDQDIDGPRLRRLPPALPDRLTALMAMARANLVVVVQHGVGSLLQTPGFFERLVYARQAAGASIAIAFADHGAPFGSLAFDLIRDPPAELRPYAVALFDRAGGPACPSFTAGPGDEVARIVELLEADHIVQWRHVPNSDRPDNGRAARPTRHSPEIREPRNARDARQRVVRCSSQPALPSVLSVRRWDVSPWPAWIPPETTVLVRHKEVSGERRVVTFGEERPAGYAPEHWLGAAHLFGPPGTSQLEVVVDSCDHQTEFRVAAPGAATHPADARCLGYIEQAALPLLQPIHVARVRSTGQLTLLAGANDVLRGHAEIRELLGYVEAFPNLPAAPTVEPREPRQYPMLVRGLAGRRHVYGTDRFDDARIVATLGRLLPARIPGSVAARLLDDGTLVTDDYRPARRHVGISTAARWVAAPISWRGQGPLLPRSRATARRLTQAASMLTATAAGLPLAPRAQTTIGYLYTTAGPNRLEIFSAVHPVTADQILTPFPTEAVDMGYVDVTSIGFTRGTRDTIQVERYGAPWASRFGLEARRG